MELFYSSDISSDTVRLDREESGHCIKVLRHKAGDSVSVIDGLGTLLHCTLLDADPREAVLRIDSREEGWGALPYRLTLGVCPTKNSDRFEWAVEKATEFGVDCIAPLIGERSERRVFKADRALRIALAATKQSLKARIPSIPAAVPVREFLAAQSGTGLKLIACCFDGPDWRRVSMREALEAAYTPAAPEARTSPAEAGPEGVPEVTVLVGPEGDFSPSAPEARTSPAGAGPEGVPEVTVLVGPEGDFSPEEVEAARAAGFVPVHLGNSRLRTETAAVAAAAFVYCRFM